MKNVYILTEEGRAYSDDGLEYITNTVREQFHDNDELVFCMGVLYNDPKYLGKELEQNPESYFVISTADDVVTVSSGGIEGFRLALQDFPDITSWKTACALYTGAQNVKVLRLYSQEDEKICYTFQPVEIRETPDWNPKWEEWHCYPEPLRVFLTDYEKLLKRHIAVMYPTKDAYSGEPQLHFDESEDNWLHKSDFEKLTENIKRELSELPENEKNFFNKLIKWLEKALEHSDMIVIESNR